MTDPNKELLARVARRAPEPPPEGPVVTVVEGEWNAPIDVTMADCNGARQVILGQVAAAKAVASRWDIAPMPVGWPDEG